jgi:two-component system sensor histidine kinase CreC
MKLGSRILLGYFLVTGLGVLFLFRIFVREVKPGVRQSTEETLIDTANLLAELVRDEVKTGAVESGRFRRAVDAYAMRQVNARIGGFAKSGLHHRVYVTDDHGIVLYDSEGKDEGADYSRWNDVRRTLRGQYGARSTRADPSDELSSVMYVAAPVRDEGRIIGVVTVAKPNKSVQPFIEAGRRHLFKAGLGLVILSLAIGISFSWWLSSSMRKIVTYAHALGKGQRVSQPKLSGELGELGSAMNMLRSELDGKNYVAEYVHALTHELKSPLAAIQGAAELLGEDMLATERARFLVNIRGESDRLRQIIDRLLDLARIEQRRVLDAPGVVDAGDLVTELVAAKEPLWRAGRLSVENRTVGIRVLGDAFLIRQALSNLLDNAIQFSPPGGVVTLYSERHERAVTVVIHNTGSEIPDFAAMRIFDRFYSLPRPGTHQKSTGLGLSFVKEIAGLHRGQIAIGNAPEGGVVARLGLPAA